MKTIGYFPGCSLHGSGRELDMSVKALARVAGVELKEVEDWNCCGASAAHNLNHNLAVALPYRDLALAEAQGLTEILAPCAACFARLKGTHVRVTRSPELAAQMREITGLEYRGTLRFVNVIEFIGRLIEGPLKGKLAPRLAGLKVAAYYGCLMSRGEDVIEDEDHENPDGMTAALEAAGAKVVDWNFATECCGGGFSMSNTDAVLDLSHELLADAEQAGAQAIVTGCPMCHSNLDMRQLTINQRGLGTHDMPVLYLSEVVGLAAGLEPKDLGLDRHFIDAMRVLDIASAAQTAQAAAAETAKK